LWFLLLGWAALQARELPRVLNYFGVVIGVAGILSVVLASLGLMAVYGLGLIIWLVWLGIVMLRTDQQTDQPDSFRSQVIRQTLGKQSKGVG
jgi:nicotinamide riboside transporter PnuC